MRPPVVAVLLILSGCVVFERRPYDVSQAPPAPVRRLISKQEAVDIAFRLCADRQLRVDRIEHTRLDPAGRWHVGLAGYLDQAQLLLDGLDGKLLKGRFRQLGTPITVLPPPDDDFE